MSISENNCHLLIDSLPNPFAYHQIIKNKEGNPVDYVLLQVNKAFEEMTGLSRDVIVGKRITEVLPKNKDNEFHCVDIYKNSIASKKSKVFENCLDILNRCYDVTTYSDAPDRLAAIFTDVTEHKQMDENLFESELKYRMLVENLSEIVYTLDENARITYVTPNIEAISGYASDEVIGRQFIDFVHPEDKKARLKEFNKINSGFKETSEYRFINKNGQVVWVRTSARLATKEEKFVAIQGILTDITEQKKAEKLIQENQAKLKATLNFLPDATFVIDLEGKVLIWNKAVEELTGVKEEEIISKGNCEYALPFYGKRRPGLAEIVIKPDPEVEKEYFFLVKKEDNTMVAESFCPCIGESGIYIWIKASPIYDSAGILSSPSRRK